MADKKELTNDEHNNKVWADIEKLEGKISELKTGLKPVEKVVYATLAHCNELTRKHAKALKLEESKNKTVK